MGFKVFLERVKGQNKILLGHYEFINSVEIILGQEVLEITNIDLGLVYRDIYQDFSIGVIK